MKGCYSNDPQAINKFTLKGGENIKIGRIVFTVKELVCGNVDSRDLPCVRFQQTYSEGTEGNYEDVYCHENDSSGFIDDEGIK